MELPAAVKPNAVFHMTYYNYIMENWPDDIKAKLPTIPGIRPDNFAALSEGFGRTVRNRAGGATRKKCRTPRRKNEIYGIPPSVRNNVLSFVLL